MSEFKVGQRVKIELEGEITYVYNGPPRVSVIDDHGGVTQVNAEWVTLADPKDWPPQMGDIWEAEGREWFCRFVAGIPGMIPEDSGTCLELPSLKALSPVLVRRRNT